ncbi:MAG: CBS domain-containing protein, partial [Candidatus Peribacteraceae bacterium]
FSEIIPKSIGAHYAPTISRLSAPMIGLLSFILSPVVYPLEKLANLFRVGGRIIGSEAQIRALASIGRRAGHIESDEGQLVHRAFLLNDKNAESIMTPLKDIVSVLSTETIREAADEVFRSTHSRYPIFGTSIHEVVGFALSKDILEALIEGRDKELVTAIKRDALVVPAHVRCDRLLMLFRDKNIHLAVVQHKAKTIGLVTLEDVLEELVGEIEDEYDVEG